MIFKLLIVDDEATMRKGIANFMDWASIGCEVAGTASDGLEAIRFLQHNHTDIVITDIKMPEADGLAVAKYVFENMPETKIILLTGYADFKYAQTAIQYDVSDFILKPTNKKDLFSSVKNAQQKIIASRKHTSIAQEEFTFLKDQLLQELTTGPFSPELAARLEQFRLPLRHYITAAFRLIPFENDISSLKKIIIGEQQNAYCYRYNNLIITIYFLEQPCPAVPSYILNNCKEIAAIAFALDSRQVAVGISHCHSGAASFGAAVSESIHALTLDFYSENNISLFSDFANNETCDLTAENSLDLFQFENSLNNWLFDDASCILNRMMAKFKTNFVNSQDAKNICTQIYYICCRVLIKKEVPSPEPDYLERIRTSSDIFTLEQTIYQLMEYTKKHFIRTIGNQSRLIDNTIKYIHENLSGSLSLESIAEHLHISPSHLSRTFKKACNESLTEFINRARIGKAKDYLMHSDILSYEIAELVGYNDPAYFSSIFKKYTGLSPTDFKQQSGKNI